MSIYGRILLISFVLIPIGRGQEATPTDRLEHARTVNLQRLAGLPNFVADELVTRYKSSHTNPPRWRYVDTIEAEIAVRGSSFARQHVRLNGKPWDKPTFPGFNWGIQFGYDIKPLFNAECGTTFEFDGHKDVRGKQLLAYRYQSPKDDCFATYTIDKNQYNPPRTGSPLIDDLTGNIIQFEEEVGVSQRIRGRSFSANYNVGLHEGRNWLLFPSCGCRYLWRIFGRLPVACGRRV